jgi:amino-acid N-acetyltransferase
MIDITRADAGDLATIHALLTGDGLPTDGLADHVATAFVARDAGRIVGAAGLEVYEDGALLRSVVVDRAFRGSGVGRRLVDAVEELARARQVPALYLLTTTAADYFPKLGFGAISRESVPVGVRQSVEFVSACPASAAVLMKRL